MAESAGSGPHRKRLVRCWRRAARREPPAQSSNAPRPALSLAGTTGVSAMRLCLLRQGDQPAGGKGQAARLCLLRCCGSDAHRFGGQRLCANPQLRTDRADAVVWQEVQRLLQNPDMIAAEYERRLHRAQPPDPDRSDLVTAKAQIAKLRRGIDRLIDGYAEGLIEKAEFEQRITGLRQRIKTWEQQAATLQDEAALRRTLSLIIGRLEDFAKQVRQRMAAPDWSLQRDLIRLLVKRVEVDHDEINVVFRVAPPPASLPPGPEGGRNLQDCWRGDRATLRAPLLHRNDQAVLHHPGREESPDEPEHALVRHPRGDPRHQAIVIDPVEKFFEIEINYNVVALGDVLLRLGHCLVGRAPWSEAVAVLGERWIPALLENLQQGLLDQPVDDAGDAELSDPALRLGDFDPSDRLRLVGSREQLRPDVWPVLTQVGPGVLDGHPINAGATLVAANSTLAASFS